MIVGGVSRQKRLFNFSPITLPVAKVGGEVISLPVPNAPWAAPGSASIERNENDLAARVSLGLWALYIPSLAVSTALRVLAWGTGTAGTIQGSIPAEWSMEAQAGFFEPGYHQPETIDGVVYGPPDW